MDRWFEEVENNTVPDVALYLVGTKLDKAESSRAVSVEEGEALAEAHGARFCEASAKTRANFRKPFVELVDMIVSRPGLLSGKAGRTAGTISVSGVEQQGYLSGCTC